MKKKKKKNKKPKKPSAKKKYQITMKSLKVRENSGIDLSIKNLISIIIAVAISVWAYFWIT